MRHCLLFVYGTLQRGYRPPSSVVRGWPDAARGVLYDLGPFPGAVNIDSVDNWFEGEVLEVDESELPALDAYEDVMSGEYARMRSWTRGGHEVWIYEYRGALPEGAVPISRWPPPATTTGTAPPLG